MNDIFKALADPSRRELLDRLNTKGGQTLTELCAGLSMTRQSVSKHLAVLEDTNLIVTAWRGREKLHYLNAAPIADISDRWINRFHRQRVAALSALKHSLENTGMGPSDFVYVTYIRATPEHLWQALTDPSFTARYWGRAYETNWQAGSPYAMTQGSSRLADPEQVILESDPPRRLSYTWHKFTPEMAREAGWDDAHLRRINSERRSTVTFEIEAQTDNTVRLTVRHSGFEEGSLMHEGISGGWPKVLSNLKTFIESGEAEALWACR
jgi:uncharacterized protein YndB with AHSA1/START domain/DNA-binding transcriptional ArsR family regulator